MQKLLKSLVPLAMAALFALSGCSAKKPAPVVKVYWPPVNPKMEWITSFSSEDNFPKSEGKLLAEKILGKEQLNYLRKPMGVVSRGDGIVYVADMDANNIRVIDFNKHTMALYSEKVPVGLPIGLALDSRGILYVADAHGKQVLKYDDRRQLLGAIGAGQLGKPTFLALDEARGRLYVSDVVSHEVLVFDPGTGKKLFSFGGKGGGKGQLYGPQGIAIDKEGRIFVAEQFNTRIQVFDAEGRHLYMFGSRGDKEFQFEGPRGLAFDSQGNLFVAEARKAAVLVFSPDGTPLTALGGGRTTHQLGFTLPTAVFVDGNDRVYISDGMNKRIAIWQMLTPAYLAEHPLDTKTLLDLEKKVRRLKEEQEK